MTRILPETGRIPHGRALPRMLGLLALGLGLFTALVGAYLGWNTMRANRALDQAAVQAQAQADALGRALAEIQQALSSGAVAEAARAAQSGAGTRQELLETLRERGIRNVLYLVNATEPLEMTALDELPGGGFAALNMLLEAGETGSAAPQAHFAGTPDEYLALAQRIEDGQQPLAVIWVATPMTVVTNVLERPQGVDGLALRQRGAGAPIQLISVGAGVQDGASAIEIPGSRFELAWSRAQALGPMSTGQLIGLFGAGVLMLVLSGLLLRRTEPGASIGALGRPARAGGDRSEATRPSTSSKPSGRSAQADAASVPGGESARPDEGDELGPLMDELSEDGDQGRHRPAASKSKPAVKPERQADEIDDRVDDRIDGRIDDEMDEATGPEDSGGLTADGEPRRAAGPSKPLEAPELGSGSQASPAASTESGDSGDSDQQSAEEIGEPVDEQAEMGEMLRALIDDGDAAAPPIGADEDESAPSRPAAPKKKPAAASAPADVTVPDASIFRAYDIRGVVGKTLDESVAEAIGRSIGSEARDRGLSRIAVARDGRLSGAKMLAALSKGLVACGLDVVDVGAVPTPVLYYAAQEIGGGSGVMVTGSHNPPDYNGFKIVLGGETLSGDSIRALHTRLAEGRLVEGEGQLGEQRIASKYIDRISNEIQLEKSLKVVVDCGNGIAGAVAPRLLEAIGADVIPLYAEVDGSFPNHHPDPGDPSTLEDLRLCVRNFEADVGVAFDGDGDRLGVVAPNGEIIYPDRVMMMFARDVLSRNEGAEIIFDVKCSGLLADEIESAGGRPVMARTGHSFIKAEIKKRKAPLAGEMSGHFFFGERWYGFDDGLYSAARLLEILAADTRAPGQIFAELPNAVSTPELKVEMKEGQAHAFVESFAKKARFEDATIHTIDGVRADFADGFGLVRASNTTPVLVLRFEGTSKEALSRIQGQFREQMLALNPSLKLPF